MGKSSLASTPSNRSCFLRTPCSKYTTLRFPGRSQDQGSALAEFALVLPLLLILLFGIIEFGIAFNRAQAVEAAAREGARLASLSSSDRADIETRVAEALDGITMDNPVAVDVTPAGCAGNQGDPITVVVETDHNLTIPILFDIDVPLTGQAVFRCEA